MKDSRLLNTNGLTLPKVAHTLFEFSNDGVLLIQDSKIVKANREAAKLLCITVEDMEGCLLKDCLPPALLDLIQKNAVSGYSQKSIVEIITSSGQTAYAEAKVKDIRDENVSYYIVVFSDVTQRHVSETSLQATEAKFKTLSDQAAVLMKMSNANNDYSFFNNAWLELVGQTEKEQQQNGWVHLIHPEDLSMTLLTLDIAFKKRSKFEVTYRLKSKNDNYHILLDTGVPYHDIDGMFQGYISSAIDITERTLLEEGKRKADAVKEMELTLQKSMSRASMVALKVTPAGAITYCNPYFVKMMKWRKGEMIGKHWREFLTHEPPELFTETGKASSLVNIECCFKDKDGQLHVTEMNIMLMGGIFKESGYTLIGEDITERISSQKALRASEEKFRNIVESFLDVYFRTDTTGRVTLITPSMYELCGYKPEEVVGKSAFAFFKRNNKFMAGFQRLMKTGNVRNLDVTVFNKQGQPIDFITNLRRLTDNDGQFIGIEGVGRDITEIKRASQEALMAKELAERSLRVKEQFLANMSHEIRTPMNGIIGVVDLLASSSLNEEQKLNVETIRESSKALLQILNDILDISKIDADKMRLRTAPVHLKNMLQKLVSLFKQQAANKGLFLTYMLHENLPAFVEADETRLLQVLSNLTSNAIKFTKKGGVTVSMMPLNSGRNGMILTKVIDTGIGISPEHIEVLFSYFSQIDNSTTRTYTGTGLGLAISKKLCQLMKGDIGVNSIEGQGSTFWFSFQASAIEGDLYELTEQEEKKIWDMGFNPDNPPEILIVDDNAINRRVAADILKKTNCRVYTATGGFKAIEMIKTHNFMVVLMDVQMPEIDGMETTKRLKELSIDLPPIIAMTAYSMEGDRERFIQDGFDDYLPKPITAVSLINKVKEYCQDCKPGGKSRRDKDTSDAGKDIAKDSYIINREAISNLKQYLDEKSYTLIFEEFKIEAGHFIAEAEDVADNLKKRMGILHTLKGNAGTMGAIELTRKVAHLEKELKQNPDMEENEVQQSLDIMAASLETFMKVWRKEN